MTRDHARIEELMAADALGGLDEDDRAALARERASHGEDCPTCRAIEAGFAETAGRLAFALTPEPVDEGMAERILATPRDELDADRIVRLPDAGPQPRTGGRSARGRGWFAVAAAIAVVAVALGVLLPRSIEVRATTSQRLVMFAVRPRGPSRWPSRRASPVRSSGAAASMSPTTGCSRSG
jgi:hypothetical protein